MPAPARRSPPKPWPMKWVALAIVVAIAVYTFFTLKYRKPGTPYRPYQDAQDRATTARLLAGGWSMIPASVSRPVTPAAPAAVPAAITRAGAGLGAELEAAFAEKPRLLAAVGRVTAPPEVPRGAPYELDFQGTLGDLHLQLGAVSVYRRDDTLVLIPAVEALPDKGLQSRGPDGRYRVRFPTQALPAGRYQVRLVASGPAAAWSFTVR